MLDVVRLCMEFPCTLFEKEIPVLFDSLCDIDSKIYVSIYLNINQVLKVATSGLHPVHRLTFSRSYGSQHNAEGYLALCKYMWHTFIEKKNFKI